MTELLPPSPTTPTAPLSTLQRTALTCLYQHRLLSTGQLKRLLLAHTAPHDTSYLRRQLRGLRGRGLADSVPAPTTAHQALWFATADGAVQVELAGEVPTRAYRMTAETAGGPLQQHTLAVNEVGTLFVETARAMGHECSPLDWTPEVAHRMRDGAGKRADYEYLISDAVLHYIVVEPHSRIQTRMFVELDRCTMTVTRLASKVSTYARYHAYVPGPAVPGRPPAGTLPAWRYRYPRFPTLLVILTGLRTAALEARIADLRALCAEDPLLRRVSDEITAGATTLDQLRERGPFADIFTPILGRDPTPVDLSMRSARGHRGPR
ncbi:replication-relaxation family protein [Actinomadura sp. 3N407]|uniref:replication-relaxation family protein n=1 Tax=Actinomadura sp. 3N407 TaxID=3457423 RepID=UPI003FCD7064